jgi:hypothetical protein
MVAVYMGTRLLYREKSLSSSHGHWIAGQHAGGPSNRGTHAGGSSGSRTELRMVAAGKVSRKPSANVSWKLAPNNVRGLTTIRANAAAPIALSIEECLPCYRTSVPGTLAQRGFH